MKILVLGASGMLGYAIHRCLKDSGIDVIGAVRGGSHRLPSDLNYIETPDGLNFGAYFDVVDAAGADVVINALGVIKQNREAEDVLNLFNLNARFPLMLSRHLNASGVKLIHFSTDCVFSGVKGNYSESDQPDPKDAYGLSKLLGEANCGGALTLRTSIIGQGLVPNHSLVDWFLSQSGTVRGFRRAIFSGLPVNAIGNFVSEYLPKLINLSGIYHISTDPIDKYSLLNLLKVAYDKFDVDICREESFEINRSLNSERLRELTGWSSAPWPELVKSMHLFYAKKNVL